MKGLEGIGGRSIIEDRGGKGAASGTTGGLYALDLGTGLRVAGSGEGTLLLLTTEAAGEAPLDKGGLLIGVAGAIGPRGCETDCLVSIDAGRGSEDNGEDTPGTSRGIDRASATEGGLGSLEAVTVVVFGSKFDSGAEVGLVTRSMPESRFVFALTAASASMSSRFEASSSPGVSPLFF